MARKPKKKPRKISNGKVKHKPGKTEAQIRRDEKLVAASKPYHWKKGQSGNPKGGPKKETTLAKILRDQLQELAVNVPEINARALALNLDPKRTTIGSVLTQSIIGKAVEGNASATKDIMDRVDAQTLGLKEIMILTGQIIEIINQEVTDPIQRNRISKRLNEMIGLG